MKKILLASLLILLCFFNLSSLIYTIIFKEDFDNTGVPSIVRTQVDGFDRMIVGTDTTTIYDMSFSGTTISTNSSGDDLNLVALGGGSVKIADTLHIDSDTSSGTVSAPTQGSIIYHDSANIKDTGIHFINDNKQGELASRRTAVLFGLIF